MDSVLFNLLWFENLMTYDINCGYAAYIQDVVILLNDIEMTY